MLQPNYEKFADEVKGKKIWVSVDETTDVMGRMIGNVVIGILNFKPLVVFLIFKLCKGT